MGKEPRHKRPPRKRLGTDATFILAQRADVPADVKRNLDDRAKDDRISRAFILPKRNALKPMAGW